MLFRTFSTKANSESNFRSYHWDTAIYALQPPSTFPGYSVRASNGSNGTTVQIACKPMHTYQTLSQWKFSYQTRRLRVHDCFLAFSVASEGALSARNRRDSAQSEPRIHVKRNPEQKNSSLFNGRIVVVASMVVYGHIYRTHCRRRVRVFEGSGRCGCTAVRPDRRHINRALFIEKFSSNARRVSPRREFESWSASWAIRPSAAETIKWFMSFKYRLLLCVTTLAG